MRADGLWQEDGSQAIREMDASVAVTINVAISFATRRIDIIDQSFWRDPVTILLGALLYC